MIIRLLIVALWLLLLAAPAQAAVTRSNVTVDKCTALSCNVDHAVGAANLEGLIFVHWFATTPRTVTAADIGGTPATFVARATNSTCAGGYYCGVELWHLNNPAVGTPSVSATLSGTAQIILIAETWAGVDGTSPLGTPVTNFGSSSAPSVSASTTVGDLVVTGLSITNAGGSPTFPSGSLDYSEFDLGGSIQGAGGKIDAVGTTTAVTWNYGSSQPWALVAVPLRPAGSGGGGGASTERLVWTDLSSGTQQETSTRVYWKHATQPTYQLIATLAPDSLTHTVTYTTETNRCYVVDQINSAGTSPLSNELCASVTAPGPIRDTLALPLFSGGLADD